MNRLSTRQAVEALAHELGDVLTVDVDRVGVEAFAQLTPPEPVLGMALRDSRRAATLARFCLERAGLAGVRLLEVEEGWLVLAIIGPQGRLFPRAPRAAPTDATSQAWTAPAVRADRSEEPAPRVERPVPVPRAPPVRFDARPMPRATLAHLRPDAVRRWLRAQAPLCDVPVVGTEAEIALARRGVLARADGVWRPTFAALVLGSDDAEDFVPNALVTVNGGEVLTRTLVAGARHLSSALRERDVATWRDAYINAWIHRDWSVPGEIEVEVDDGDLRIVSPGAPLSGSPEARRLRNPLLATLATSLGYCAGEGTGLARLGEALVALGGAPFELTTGDGCAVFRAALPPAAPPPRPKPATRDSTPIRGRVASSRSVAPAPSEEPPPDPASPEVPRAVGDDADAILAHLRSQGPSTAKALAAALGCSRPTISRRLAPLVASGVVRAEAEGPSSPFQRYALA